MSDKEGSPGLCSRSRSESIENDGSRYIVKDKRSRSRSRSRGGGGRGGGRSRYSRSRSRSPSRRRHSRSRSRSPYHNRRRSRHSRSRSYSPRHRNGRTRSTSPLSGRRRHIGSRDRPKTSRCLGVFGLSLYTTEREVKDIIGRYGPIENINLVHDHQTGRSRGFAFIYMRNLEDAVECKERAPGTEIDGHKIRVDYSITERAHTPTPGVYLGRPTGRGYYRSDRNSRRSPSPHNSSSGGRRGSRYSRSRSRSRSYGRY